MNKQTKGILLPLGLIEFRHNLTDHDFDVFPHYKVDYNEAKKILRGFQDVNMSLLKINDGLTGTWKQVDKDKYQCSICGITHHIVQYPNSNKNYCPNCGSNNK